MIAASGAARHLALCNHLEPNGERAAREEVVGPSDVEAAGRADRQDASRGTWRCVAGVREHLLGQAVGQRGRRALWRCLCAARLAGAPREAAGARRLTVRPSPRTLRRTTNTERPEAGDRRSGQVRVMALVLLLVPVTTATAAEAWRSLPQTPTWPPAVVEGKAPVKGVEIYYAEYGAGQPVILLHAGHRGQPRCPHGRGQHTRRSSTHGRTSGADANQSVGFTGVDDQQFGQGQRQSLPEDLDRLNPARRPG